MKGLVYRRRVANTGGHGHSATLHLETLWIRDLTITMGLSALPFASQCFPLGEQEALAGTV